MLTTWNQEPTCCIADVQMYHIFLLQEEGPEIGTTGCQHSFVCLKVDPIHHEGAVAKQTLLALVIELVQDLPAVPWKLHCFSKACSG